MDLKIANHLALISASTKGIGFAIAKRLAAEGARVIVNGRSAESVDDAAKRIVEDVPDAKIEKFAGDLSDPTIVAKLAERFPKVDIVVNNLGSFDPKPFSEISDHEWRDVFEMNVLTGVRLSRLYFDAMLERDYGRIVFISSESGLQIPSEMIHYGVTKTAQLAVARGLAELTTGSGVTVNAVLPGPTRTEGVEEFAKKLGAGDDFDEFEKEFFTDARPTSLIKRFEKPEEIADVVAFVCSPLASAMNGAAIRAEGGIVKAIA